MPLSAPLELLKIVGILAAAGADFVIIGGVAVRVQGGDHDTKDADFAIIRRLENAKMLARALAPYHPTPLNWPEGLPFVWDEQTIMGSTTLTLVTDLGRIDFLAEPDGAPPYQELKARAMTFEMDGYTIYVACIEDLISMKRAAGRTKDLAHIAELETIRRLIAEGRV